MSPKLKISINSILELISKIAAIGLAAGSLFCLCAAIFGSPVETLSFFEEVKLFAKVFAVAISLSVSAIAMYSLSCWFSSKTDRTISSLARKKADAEIAHVRTSYEHELEKAYAESDRLYELMFHKD